MATPQYDILVFGIGSDLPAGATELFRAELAHSLGALNLNDPRGAWSFACVCAIGPSGGILGGVYFDMGPINDGPLAHEKVAVLEQVLVRPEFRRQGIATALMRKAIQVAKDAGCSHVRCNCSWDNIAGIALYKRCGFALADIAEPGAREYFTVRPL